MVEAEQVSEQANFEQMMNWRAPRKFDLLRETLRLTSGCIELPLGPLVRHCLIEQWANHARPPCAGRLG